jgi:hypothetical protein
MNRLTGTFTAHDDFRRDYTIYVYLEDGSHDDPNAAIEGRKELRTADGALVNRKRKGVYEIMASGLILLSSAHEAP